MGKSIDNLPLRDDPPAAPTTTSALSPEVQAFQARITELLVGGKAAWAADTLEGIYATVARYNRVTTNQERAVDNIEARANQPRDPYRRSERTWDKPRFDDVPRCRRCRRELTDPESIERGIGPECLEKYRAETGRG